MSPVPWERRMPNPDADRTPIEAGMGQAPFLSVGIPSAAFPNWYPPALGLSNSLRDAVGTSESTAGLRRKHHSYVCVTVVGRGLASVVEASQIRHAVGMSQQHHQRYSGKGGCRVSMLTAPHSGAVGMPEPLGCCGDGQSLWGCRMHPV